MINKCLVFMLSISICISTKSISPLRKILDRCTNGSHAKADLTDKEGRACAYLLSESSGRSVVFDPETKQFREPTVIEQIKQDDKARRKANKIKLSDRELNGFIYKRIKLQEAHNTLGLTNMSLRSLFNATQEN